MFSIPDLLQDIFSEANRMQHEYSFFLNLGCVSPSCQLCLLSLPVFSLIFFRVLPVLSLCSCVFPSLVFPFSLCFSDSCCNFASHACFLGRARFLPGFQAGFQCGRMFTKILAKTLFTEESLLAFPGTPLRDKGGVC